MSRSSHDQPMLRLLLSVSSLWDQQPAQPWLPPAHQHGRNGTDIRQHVRTGRHEIHARISQYDHRFCTHWCISKNIDAFQKTSMHFRIHRWVSKNIDAFQKTLMHFKKHWCISKTLMHFKNIDAFQKISMSFQKHWCISKNVDAFQKISMSFQTHWCISTIFTGVLMKWYNSKLWTMINTACWLSQKVVVNWNNEGWKGLIASAKCFSLLGSRSLWRYHHVIRTPHAWNIFFWFTFGHETIMRNSE